MGIFSKEEVKQDKPMPPEVVRTFNETHDPEIGISGTTRVNISTSPIEPPYRIKFAKASADHINAVELEEKLEEKAKECEKEVTRAKNEYERVATERSKAASARRETGDKLAALLGYKKGY